MLVSFSLLLLDYQQGASRVEGLILGGYSLSLGKGGGLAGA